VLESGSQEIPQTYEALEIKLVPRVEGLEEWRLRFHPLRVGWRIQAPGASIRTTETDGFTLVQYFPSEGEVEVTASLRWAGEEIPLPSLKFEVRANPDYRKRGVFETEWAEVAVIAAAIFFAIITAIGLQYDSTFGSLSQYLALFVWAAGAGTGGNLFSQLGQSSAPGGAVATLK
jgi:hypothetical protein